MQESRPQHGKGCQRRSLNAPFILREASFISFFSDSSSDGVKRRKPEELPCLPFREGLKGSCDVVFPEEFFCFFTAEFPFNLCYSFGPDCKPEGFYAIFLGDAVIYWNNSCTTTSLAS